MRYFLIILLILQWWAGPVWAQNDHGISGSDGEMRARGQDWHGQGITAGCDPAVPSSSLTMLNVACDGYVLDGQELAFARQLAKDIALPAVDGNHWLALQKTTTALPAGWTQAVFGSRFLRQQVAAQPADPAQGFVWAKVVVASSIITSIEVVAPRRVMTPQTVASNQLWTGITTIGPGGLLTKGSGITLTLLSPDAVIAAPTRQIFAGLGDVRFSRGGTVWIDWFFDGADGDGAITQAFASLTGLTGTVRGGAQTYNIDATIALPTTGSLTWENYPATTYTATAVLTEMIGLERLTFFEIRNGTFDGNTNADWVFSGQFALGYDIPLDLRVDNIKLTTEGGTIGEKLTGGGFDLRATGDLTVRHIKVVDSTFDGIKEDTGEPFFIQGFNDPQNIHFIFNNNRVFNWLRGPFANELIFGEYTGNRIRNISDHALTARGRRHQFEAGDSLDSRFNHGISILYNNIDQTNFIVIPAPPDEIVQLGIVVGKGAGPVVIAHNHVYGNSGAAGVTVGISVDGALGPTQPPSCPVGEPCGAAFETRTIVQGNTVRSYSIGIAGNGSNESVRDNTVTDQTNFSLLIKGNSGQEGWVVRGNLIQDKPIKLGEVGAVHPATPFDTFISGNTFRDILGATVIDEPNESWGTRAPISIQTDPLKISRAGLAADLFIFNTLSAGVVLDFPMTQQIGPGQEFTVMHSSGTNTITLNTVTRTFIDTGVNITLDTIVTSSALFDTWDVDGIPVQIDLNSGVLPVPLLEKTIYYVIIENRGLDRIQLATTEANAIAGTQIDLTTTGNSVAKFIGDMLYSTTGVLSRQAVISDHTVIRKYLSGLGAWYAVR